MTEPVKVEQVDREIAASGYYAWLSGNRTIPEKMVAGAIDDHSMIQAFARHRLAERQRIYDMLKEPTEEMVEVGIAQIEECTDDWSARAACAAEHSFRAMLAASPLARSIDRSGVVVSE